MTLPRLRLRNLQSRILLLFLLLMVGVQVGGFLLVNTVGMASAHKTVGDEVVAGARVFDRLLEQDSQRLVQGARVLTLDFAFREAMATGERETMTSVLANHGERIGAALMMLVGLDQRVVANTAGAAAGEPFAYPELLAKAEVDGQASGVVLLQDQLYQLVLVPVLSPLPVAWVAVGFRINDALAQDLGNLTTLQVSFLSRQSGKPWKLQASTLRQPARTNLLADFEANRFAASDSEGNAVFGEDTVTRVLTLSSRAGETVITALQEPLYAALEPFRRLQRQLVLISLFGVAVSILLALVIARGIARPVRNLAGVARRIAGGDYSTMPLASRADEIGDLAAAFRVMQEGIATREARITDLAYRDALTRLPNRLLCTERIDEALAAAIHSGSRVAMLLMNLDNFKYVNETLGHAIGDLLLREVAARLRLVVPDPADCVARLGGDEFLILLPGRNGDAARQVADSVLRALEAPMTLEEHIVDIRASIGIAVFPDHGSERSRLLRHADVAMYIAKRDKLSIALWDSRYQENTSDRLSLMTDLRKAVDNGEFTLVYQPMSAFAGGDELHVEALIRWQHATRGNVVPADFIQFAEHTGYVRAITRWVLANAIAQCAAWRRSGIEICLSVNISARDVMDADLPNALARMLEHHAYAAHWLSLEITENSIVDDPANAIVNLDRLRALGCKLAIDDFGTGYSSLSYLSRLPVQVIKIDKSFVMGMLNDASAAAIVRSTIDLAHNMGLVVVAEGIEDEATYTRLRSLGCDVAQGYLLSKPLSAAEVPAFMRESQQAPERRRASAAT